MAGIPLIVLALLSPALWRRGRVYPLATVLQSAFYLLGIVGLSWDGEDSRGTDCWLPRASSSR